jgi:hypothetical protein
MVKLFLKQGISHQLGRDAVVRFECENSAIDVIINVLSKIFHKPIDHRTCGRTKSDDNSSHGLKGRLAKKE